MRRVLTVTVTCAAVVLLSANPLVLAQGEETKPRGEAKRPSLSLKTSQNTGMVPIRISATAELRGGDDDFQDYYCPTIEWNWGDGTISEATNDCDPYEPGKSQIRRRYTGSHNYKRSGSYRISFRLKRKDKVVTSSTTLVRLLGGY
jgi:hypothetical protein